LQYRFNSRTTAEKCVTGRPDPHLREFRGKLYFIITLGCFRNEVESDLLRSELLGLGLEQAATLDEAQVIIVNTCGFIKEACEEGIDTILEVDRITRGLDPRPKILIVGCMCQRYGEGLLKSMPEVSCVLGVDWKDHLDEALRAAMSDSRFYRASMLPNPCIPVRTFDSSDNATVFVRVSDGCSRACSFCAIPGIRGPHKSRYADDILSEIKRFSKGGEREVVLLAQDLTSYGSDLPSGTDLAGLLRRITGLKNVRWVRLLYLQPEGVTPELVSEMVENPRICDYFDIPFQHASHHILKRMGRPGDGGSYRQLVDSIRDKSPDAAIRTTVMVGYPGETGEDFNTLAGFIKDLEFDWLGVFRFSAEAGTPAAELPGQVPHDTAVERYDRILEIQDSIEASGVSRLIGGNLEVVIDSMSDEENYYCIGRSYREAPLIDGVIYIQRKKGYSRKPKVGDFLRARITGTEGLDIVAEI